MLGYVVRLVVVLLGEVIRSTHGKVATGEVIRSTHDHQKPATDDVIR